jgi:hypothetical protein
VSPLASAFSAARALLGRAALSPRGQQFFEREIMFPIAATLIGAGL